MNTIDPTSKTDLLEIYNKTFSDLRFSKRLDHVYEGVYYFIQNEGKQIRPLLLMHSCEMFGGNIGLALNPAYAIQMFHNSTLVHDDIIDQSEYRRNQLAVYKKFNRNTAIMTGDMMLIIAYKYLLENNEKHLAEILGLFNQTAVRIMEGQQLDLEFENLTYISEEDYLYMIECKTSVLIAASLEIGAIVAGATKKDRKNIFEFGRNIGMAFQIKDDWLDAFGTTQTTGKKVGGDILQNKKTYLLVKALELSNENQKGRIKEIFSLSDENEKIHRMLILYNELNIPGCAEEKMNVFYQQAFHHLSLVEIDNDRKQPLIELTNQLYNRNK